MTDATDYIPHLSSVSEIPSGSKVLLRMDMDVPMKEGRVQDARRLKKSLATINALLDKDCVIVILGHRGRPKGVDETLSLRVVFETLVSFIVQERHNKEIQSTFIDDINNETVFTEALSNARIICLENLRFFKGEEDNDPEFLHMVVKKTQWFVNDAFAVSHRMHRSIQLYKDMPTAYGIAFIDEVTRILHVIKQPDHPITIILGGAKEDKLSYLPDLEHIGDHILIGGKLPLFMHDKQVAEKNEKYTIARLNEQKLDLSKDDIAVFTQIISQSRTIIWAGAMGFFEDPQYQEGTTDIAKAVVDSHGYSILAGGDTEASVLALGLENQINLIASGGGAMLELLTKKTLPAWK